MATPRHVLLGLAPPRAAWFTDLARQATTGQLPVEFVKCVSSAELRARCASGRAWSAALVDARAPGVDRDLLAAASAAGVVVLIVGDELHPRRWEELGAAAVLAVDFDRNALVEALRRHARPLHRPDAAGPFPAPLPLDAAGPHAPPGALVAVTGDPGTGVSTVAGALSQVLAADGAAVVLADLALRADQALLHGIGDVIPGLPELIEAHRLGIPDAAHVHEILFAIDERGYRLLLGLRRHRDWAALRPRAFAAALTSLRRTHDVVVCDVDAEIEGETETGSPEVEERNTMARTVLGQADVVAVVGESGVKGVHGMVRVIQELLAFGVPGDRVLPVVNRAPRSPRARAEISHAVADLLGGRVGPTLLVGPQRRLEQAVRDRRALPTALGAPLRAAVTAVLDHHGPREQAVVAGMPVVPGSLGHWTGTDDA